MQVQYFISRFPVRFKAGEREMKYCTCIRNLKRINRKIKSLA